MFKKYKKYSALCALFIGTIGCGKAIKDSNKSDDVVQRTALTAPTINFDLDYSSDLANSAVMEYEAKKSGWVKIPVSPYIVRSALETINTRVYINSKPNSTFVKTHSELFCDYASIKIADGVEQGRDGYVHFFKGCKEDIDFDGTPDEVNYIPGELVALDENNLIVLEINTNEQNGEVQVRTEIEVDWN